MAPKKNAFSIFISQHINDDIVKGIKPTPSFQQVATRLTPVWNSMSAEEKNKYKSLAREFNLKNGKPKPLNQIHNLRNNSFNYWKMHENLIDMFENIKDNQQLLKEKFILLHINCHSHVGEQYYFPAEIAVLEFNLSTGVTRTFHKIIGISKIYPRGFAGSMREYSDKFHQIYCWNEHYEDYKTILLDLFKFLKDGEKDDNLLEGSVDLPYMYTIESEICLDIMKTKSSLEKLYNTVYPDHDFERSQVFKIGSIERLLYEMKKKLNIHLDPRNIQEGMTVHEILESDMYGSGLGCNYHEIRDIAFKCSKARVLQWMSNICKHISEFIDLKLIAGRHMAVQLRDGSRLIVENHSVPLSKRNLKIKENKFNQNSLSNMLCEPFENIKLCSSSTCSEEDK